MERIKEIREKVMNALKRCKSYGQCDDDSCPYYREVACLKELRQDAIALLKEQDAIRWISVNDRLPTYAELKDDCVLVMFDDGTICSTGFDECIENESIFGEWRQNFDPVTLGATDSYWMPLEGVTHWMPIPKLMQKG